MLRTKSEYKNVKLDRLRLVRFASSESRFDSHSSLPDFSVSIKCVHENPELPNSKNYFADLVPHLSESTWAEFLEEKSWLSL